jgi:hypothetical protein
VIYSIHLWYGKQNQSLLEQSIRTIKRSFFLTFFGLPLVVTGLGIGFGVGFYYKQIKTVEMPSKMVVVEKQDIILAVDENQRLMVNR